MRLPRHSYQEIKLTFSCTTQNRRTFLQLRHLLLVSEPKYLDRKGNTSDLILGIGEMPACAYAQTFQSLCRSYTQTMDVLYLVYGTTSKDLLQNRELPDTGANGLMAPFTAIDYYILPLPT